MGDAENLFSPSKKRAAGREITKDNPGLDDEGDSSEETGTFKKASDEVLASRRIVKVRRNQSSTAPSSNPFSGIRLVTPAAATEVAPATEKAPENKEIDSSEEAEKSKDETRESAEAKAETAVEKEVNDDKQDSNSGAEVAESKAVDENPSGDHEKSVDNAESKAVDENLSGDHETENEKTVDNEEAENKTPAENDKIESDAKKDDDGSESNNLSSFQQLSSTQNAFTGLAGTGFSTATFSFGLGSTNGSTNGTTIGSLFGNKVEQPSFSFGVDFSTNGSSAIFNTTGPSITSKNECPVFPPMQEVPVETGEENEKNVFTADSVLFEYINGAWKERGKGELKVNVATTSGAEKARLLMRARGNYRLILNASLYPDMKLANMEKKGITFACVNSVGEGKDSLSTFALKFKDGAILEEFRAAVTAHKDKATVIAALKTPENSPKASEE